MDRRHLCRPPATRSTFIPAAAALAPAAPCPPSSHCFPQVGRVGSSTDLIVQVVEYVPAPEKRQMVLDLLQTLEKVRAAAAAAAAAARLGAVSLCVLCKAVRFNCCALVIARARRPDSVTTPRRRKECKPRTHLEAAGR